MMRDWLQVRAGWRGWALLILLVALLQASFWWISAAVQRLPESPEVVSSLIARSARVQLLEEVEAPVSLPPIADARESRLPMVPSEAVRNQCVRGSHYPAARVQIDHEFQAGQQGQGLLIQFAADNVAAYLNGQRLAPPRGKFDTRPSRDGRRPWLLELPASQLKAGINTVDLVVVHNGCLPMVTHVEIGDYATLKGLFDKAAEMRLTVPWLAVGMAMFVGLAALVLLPIADNRRLILAFGLMMIALAGRSYYSIWNDWRFDQAAYAATGAIIAILNGATTAYFVHVVSGERRRLEGRLIIGLTVANMVLILAAYGLGWTSVLTYADAQFLFVAALYTAVRLLLWYRTDPVQALWPAVVFSIYVTTTINGQVMSWLMIPMTFNTKHLLPFYLVTGLGIIMLYRGFNLYRAAETARASLAIQVAEKEQEIRASYLKLREQEKLNAIHAERQRLISDMHDGMGGQLMSLLMLVKGKSFDPAQLPQAVQAIIEDLRLIIDSMDSAGDTLEAALRSFRDRALPRLKAAGIEVVWRDELGSSPEGFRPQQILQLYRILQEAVTNVQKHAGASRLDIAVLADPQAEDGFMIRIADDGAGLGEQVGKGRGMVSMRRRAAELGGRLELSQGEPRGLVLTIHLPRPAGAEAVSGT